VLFVPTRERTRIVPLFYKSDSIPKVERVAVARSLMQRVTGLLECQSFSRSQGLFFPTGNALHTKGMSFSIDVLWLRPQRDVPGVFDVVDSIEDLRPGREARCVAAAAFVELATGTLGAIGAIPSVVGLGVQPN
jgi:uncharacterized membrane protein (UPF0127 family)